MFSGSAMSDAFTFSKVTNQEYGQNPLIIPAPAEHNKEIYVCVVSFSVVGGAISDLNTKATKII